MFTRLLAEVWQGLEGKPDLLERLAVSGADGSLPSRFEVSALAAAAIGAAALAAAELWSKRRDGPIPGVTVNRRLAEAAFIGERLLAPDGWQLPSPWDPLTGDYATADGWIRLHVNYSYHRDAALRVLGVQPERARIESAVRDWRGEVLETEVVRGGGCAAVLRTMEAWATHPQGAAVAREPLVAYQGRCSPRLDRQAPESPLGGIRVLDMTRVIAGPAGTRYLAALGAEVLRIDPPGFSEVPALLPEVTRGKRCAFLDLKSQEGRAVWERLVAQADVLVHGYRPGAMEALGFTDARIRSLNANLVEVRYDAYGWSGPWYERRGFDSLVQMSSGIAHPVDGGKPTPLPAQALDYGTGYLVAAAVCRALTEGYALARLSLARTARLLVDQGTGDAGHGRGFGEANDVLERAETDWGPVRQVRFPCVIEGHAVHWRERAGPLGRHAPAWIL